MIQGINITLSPPILEMKSLELKKFPEVNCLLESLTNYFSQNGIIYDAELIVSNCEYEELQSKFGKYKKRIDYSFKLRYLEKIVLYDECIEFHVLDNDITNVIRVKVGKNFFYFLEWENEYYL